MSSPSSKRPHPLAQLTLMRLRTMAREPGVIFWVFGFPVLLSLALGIAFRVRGPEPVVVGALPGVSARVHEALAAGHVEVKDLDRPLAQAALRSGKVTVLLVPGDTPEAPLTYRFDPSRPEAKATRATVDGILQRAAGQTTPLAVLDEKVHERGSRYIDFLIPGLIAMNIMSGSLWGIGWVIVEMRVRKLLKRLLAAPMRRRDLMFSFGLARLVIIPAELLFILLFARLAFDVRVTGSYLALALMAFGGSACFASLSVLVSSRAQNTETVSGLMNLVMMPMFITSGVFFAATHFPDWLQPVIRALPLTAMCDGMRAVMIDGAGVLATWPYLGIMALWAVPSFVLGLRYFRWQ
jgi:ABC-2 type transport system permease protein